MVARWLRLPISVLQKVFQKIDMHLPVVSIPRTNAPGFRKNVDVAVAIHIERRAANIGLIVCADDMLNPVRCATELEPIQAIRLHAASAQHEIQIAIAVEVHERGQALVARAAFADGQIATDEVMLETEVGGDGGTRENDASQCSLSE